MKKFILFFFILITTCNAQLNRPTGASTGTTDSTTVDRIATSVVNANAADIDGCTDGNIVKQTSAGVFTAGAESRGTPADSMAIKTDFPRVNLSVLQDSSYINVIDTLIIALPDYAVILDSIGTVQQLNTGASVVYKFIYATSIQGTWTSIITSPATITAITTASWQTTLNNATLPANGFLGILCTTVTTKPKLTSHRLIGHRVGTNGVAF
jgi:hypothetical protein